MAVVDWFFVIVLVVSTCIGLWRGLIREVVSLASWVAAFLLAPWLAADVAQLLHITVGSEGLNYALGWVVVFVVIILLGGVLAWGLKQMAAATGLGLVDRGFGAAFGLLRGVLFLVVLTAVVRMTPLQEVQAWKQAQAPVWSSAVVLLCKPLLPEKLAKYIQKD